MCQFEVGDLVVFVDKKYAHTQGLKRFLGISCRVSRVHLRGNNYLLDVSDKEGRILFSAFSKRFAFVDSSKEKNLK